MTSARPLTELRALAQRRLQHLANPSPEEWARAVAEALKRGRQLIRIPRGPHVEIRLDI